MLYYIYSMLGVDSQYTVHLTCCGEHPHTNLLWTASDRILKRPQVSGFQNRFYSENGKNDIILASSYPLLLLS